MDVLEFRGPYRFLSNFAPILVLGPGLLAYPSVEHAYQASKTSNKKHWRLFSCSEAASGAVVRPAALSNEALLALLEVKDVEDTFQITAGEAKRLGKLIDQRTTWDDTTKLSVMRHLVKEKFSSSDYYRRQLLAIDGKIEEGNSWRDVFWGVSPVGSGQGQNWLGRILMETRDWLKAGNCAEPEDDVFWSDDFWSEG